jgi:hypothetical protein
MNVIKDLFFKIPDIDDAKLIVHKIIEKEKQHKQELETSDNLDVRNKIIEIQKSANQALETIYKQYINDNAKILTTMKLTKDEQQTLKYLNMNPRIVLVFDDCTELLMNIKRSQAIRQLFFQGRWQYITFIIGCHTDKALDGELRKAAFVSIFTTKDSANGYIDRPSNNLTKEAKKIGCQSADIAFSQKHQKLVWVRDERKYYKFTATLRSDFRFGSDFIWSYCKAIENDGKIIKNNKYISMF